MLNFTVSSKTSSDAADSFNKDDVTIDADLGGISARIKIMRVTNQGLAYLFVLSHDQEVSRALSYGINPNNSRFSILEMPQVQVNFSVIGISTSGLI